MGKVLYWYPLPVFLHAPENVSVEHEVTVG